MVEVRSVSEGAGVEDGGDVAVVAVSIAGGATFTGGATFLGDAGRGGVRGIGGESGSTGGVGCSSNGDGCCSGQGCFTARAPSPRATLAHVGETGEFGGRGWVSWHPA
jgi:hypothetical protein